MAPETVTQLEESKKITQQLNCSFRPKYCLSILLLILKPERLKIAIFNVTPTANLPSSYFFPLLLFCFFLFLISTTA